MNQESQFDYQKDEKTLKELILNVKEYIVEGFRKIHWIAMIAIPLAGYLGYKAYTATETYSEKITFMVNSDDGNSVNSVASILGQIGFGGGGQSRLNIDKILELARTRRIVGEVLLDSCEIDAKEDLIANHIIDIYELNKKWAEDDPEMLDFRFSSNDPASLSLKEASIFKNLYIRIIGNAQKNIEGLVSNSYSDETGIMKMSSTTQNEMLTYHLLNKTFDALSQFYVDKTIEKQKVTYDLVAAKKDSIYEEMQKAEYGVANFRETNRNLVDTRQRLREIQLTRQAAVLGQVYAEAVKNTEISDFTLKNTTPFVQVIDAPLLPIKGESPSLIMEIIKGGLIGGFLGLFFVWGRKLFRDTMSDSN